MLGVLPGQAEGAFAKYGSMGEYERAMRHYGILGSEQAVKRRITFTNIFF